MDFLKLRAILTCDTTDYEAKLSTAESKAQTFGGKLKNGLTKAGAFAVKGLAAASGAVGAFGVASIKTGATFDKAMSQVAATMGMSVAEINDGSTQASQDFKRLRDFAQEMGRTTAFSATEASEALNYMALAGYDVNKSMEMLPNVLNLAAAGNMDLARASDMVTDAQTAFGMNTKRTTQMVDEMAKAASTGNTSVEQLGDAFLVVGGLAKELNGGMVTLANGTKKPVDGIQELEIALTAMANAGIKGSEAGTHMRNMLMKLSSPTSEGTKQLEALGVSVFDAEGNMRSLHDIMGDLNSALGNLTQQEKIQAIGELFNARDLSSAEALLAAVGEDWDKIGESILDSKDAASQMAETQLDNLSGDITLFKSALEGAQIAISDGLSPALRGFVKEGTKGVSDFAEKIKSGDLSGAIAGLGQNIANLAVEVVKQVPKMIKAGAQLLVGIGQGIAQNASVLIESAKEIVSFIYNSIIENAPTLMNSAGELVTMLFDGIMTNAPKLVDSAVSLINEFSTGFVTGIPQFLAQALPMIEQLTGMLRENAGKLVDAGINLILNIAQGVANAIPTLIQYIPQIVINIAGIINDNAPKLLSAGVQIIGKLLVGIISAIPTIIANIPKIIQAIVSVFMAFNWIQIGTSIITFIGNGIRALGTAIPQALRNIGQTAVEWLSAINWATLGADIIDLIVIGLQALASVIPTALQAIGTAAIELFKSIDWLGVGTFVVEGLISGISSLASAAVEAIIGVGTAILDGFKSLFGIASPSTVMEEQGNFLIEGLINTLTNLPGAIGEVLTGALDVVVSWGADLLSKGVKASEDFLSGVSERWEGLKQKTSEAFESVKKKVGTTLNTAKDTAIKKATELKDRATEKWNNLKEKTTKVYSNIKEKISTNLSNAKDKAVQTVTTLKDKAVEKWNNLKDKTAETYSNIKEKISTNITNAKETAVSIAETMRGNVSGKWENLKSTTNEKWDNIKEYIASKMKDSESKATGSAGTLYTNVSGKFANAAKAASVQFANLQKAITDKMKSALSNASSSANSIATKITSKFKSAQETTSTVFSNILSNVKSKMKEAASAVENAVQKMKDKMHFHWSLPHLKLPHVHISGKFSINPPSAPHFSISWYKKAMDTPWLFSSPTVIPAMGFGDGAGSEIVYGKDSLMRDIREAQNSERVEELLGQILARLNQMDTTIMLDGRTVSQSVDRRLGNTVQLKQRGVI